MKTLALFGSFQAGSARARRGTSKPWASSGKQELFARQSLQKLSVDQREHHLALIRAGMG